jgi:hypothetical protein
MSQTQDSECPICYEIIGDKNNIITECNHNFHASCIMQNITRNGFNCPCCRQAMTENAGDNAESDSDEDADDDDDSYEDTLIDDYYNEYELRGLRFFTNLLEGNDHDQLDIIEEHQFEEDLRDHTEEDETNSEYTTPPVDFVILELKKQNITYEDFVKSVLSDCIQYKNQNFDNISNEIWGRTCSIIEKYTLPEVTSNLNEVD